MDALEWGRMADPFVCEKLSGGFRIFDALDEDGRSLANVGSGLIELMVLDRFLVVHAVALELRDDQIVIVRDDRLDAESLADANDAVIEAVYEQNVIVDVGQKFSDCSSHGLAFVRSGVG